MGSTIEGDSRGYDGNKSVTYRHRLNYQRLQTAEPVHPELDGQEVRLHKKAQILQMDGTFEESVTFMQQELSEAGEHHQPEVIGAIMAQLSTKAA